MGLLKELRAEVLRGIPRIEWTGTQQLRVEGHSGLQRYAPHLIEISSAVGRLVVAGKGMVIRSLTSDGGVIVEGYIGSVSYVEDGAKLEEQAKGREI